jgi:hypothetical protein
VRIFASRRRETRNPRKLRTFPALEGWFSAKLTRCNLLASRQPSPQAVPSPLLYGLVLVPSSHLGDGIVDPLGAPTLEERQAAAGQRHASWPDYDDARVGELRQPSFEERA